MPDPTPTVRVYTRISTGYQLDNYSMAAQKARAEAWCAYQGHTRLTYYPEPAVSGRLDERPQLSALFDDLQAGDIVLVYALSRLGRGGAVQLLGMVNRIRDLGARLVSVTEDIDTKTPTGRLMLTILAALAELEVEITRERMEAGRLQAAQQGVFPHSEGALPMGWTRGADGRVVEGEHADTVRLVFRLCAGGRAYLAVADELNRLGVPGARGGRWAVTQVRRIIRTESYWTGVLHYRAETYPDQPELWIPIPAPPLVDEATWQAAQRDRARNHVHRRPETYPLTGHLLCSCGAPIMGRTNRGAKPSHRDGRYYRCLETVRRTETCSSNGRRTRLWPADRAEQSAREALSAVLATPEAYAAFSTETRPPVDETAAERADLERRLAALLDLYLDGELDREAYRVRRQALLDTLASFTPAPVTPVVPEGLDRLAQLARTASGPQLYELAELLDLRFVMELDGNVRLVQLDIPVL